MCIATAPYALELRSVSRRFGAIQALSEVGFLIRSGEVMALLGENGAGKSTAVKVMAGFDTDYQGKSSGAGGSSVSVRRRTQNGRVWRWRSRN